MVMVLTNFRNKETKLEGDKVSQCYYQQLRGAGRVIKSYPGHG